eukprot:172559_1
MNQLFKGNHDVSTVWNTNNQSNHTIWTIGANVYGQQANGTTTKIIQLSRMHSLPSNINVINITTGSCGTTYILCRNNTIIVCGFNEYGIGSIQNTLIPFICQNFTHHRYLFIPHQIFNIIYSYIPNPDHIKRKIKLPTFIRRFNIQTISHGIASNHKFILNTSNVLYGSGYNEYNQLGIKGYKPYTWRKIDFFQQNKIQLKQICCEAQHTVFLTTNGELYRCGNKSNISKIQLVIKIRLRYICCGARHILALDANYDIYSFGNNKYGQLGCENVAHAPQLIDYFVTHKIKIIRIGCGESHSGVLDVNGKLYMFGRNWDYECGDGTEKNVEIPKVNKTLKNVTIVDIKCGYHHNVAKSITNEYYMWGDNDSNQCLIYDKKQNVSIPTNVSDALDVITDDFEIVTIYPGFRETRVIVSRME